MEPNTTEKSETHNKTKSSTSRTPRSRRRLKEARSWDQCENPYTPGVSPPVVVTKRRDALSPKMATIDMCKYSEKSPLAKARDGSVSLLRVLSYELQASFERRGSKDVDMVKLYKMKPDVEEVEVEKEKKGLGIFKRLKSAPGDMNAEKGKGNK